MSDATKYSALTKTLILVAIIGALNWGLIGFFNFNLVDAIFGDNPQESGTIRFGGQTIEFVRGLEEVTLTITDDATGEVTTIVIPTFVEVN